MHLEYRDTLILKYNKLCYFTLITSVCMMHPVVTQLVKWRLWCFTPQCKISFHLVNCCFSFGGICNLKTLKVGACSKQSSHKKNNHHCCSHNGESLCRTRSERRGFRGSSLIYVMVLMKSFQQDPSVKTLKNRNKLLISAIKSLSGTSLFERPRNIQCSFKEKYPNFFFLSKIIIFISLNYVFFFFIYWI